MTTAPRPMLASLGTANDIPDEENWAFEMKWDGIRAIARTENGRTILWSRSGRDVSPAYPELAGLAEALGGRAATLDGEIVVLDKRGRPDFGLLQGRMNLTRPAEITRAAASIPVNLMLFDLLELDGRSLLREPYDDRRSMLETLCAGIVAPFSLPAAFEGDLAAAIETSRTLGLEGVVAKRRDSRYDEGGRSRAWTKIKHHRAQEVVVGGWRPGNGRRANGVGSLLLGVPDADGFRYVGRVGTGFTDRTLEQIAATLANRPRKTSGLHDVPSADARDAHWVTPDLVGEVEFAEWTGDGRLRQPVWRGWRPDKSTADIHFE
ncbi:MAG: ATP-dependent ligase [Microbacteriaceae bacterium]|nr:ATP-dependent ligase [Microbacteriaceae bacterium]